MKTVYKGILLFLILALASVSLLKLDTVEYDGIAFYYDQGFGTEESKFAIHDPKTGEFIANVFSESDYDEATYFGYIPKNGDHILYTRYHLDWRWENQSTYGGVFTASSTEKSEKIPYVEPQKLKFTFNIVVHSSDDEERTIYSGDEFPTDLIVDTIESELDLDDEECDDVLWDENADALWWTENEIEGPICWLIANGSYKYGSESKR